jgi:hypothetical protein
MTRTPATALLGLSLLAGCEEAFVTDAVLPLEDAVVALDRSAGRARILRVGADGVEDESEIAFEDVDGAFLLPRPGDPDQVLFFHRGRIGDAEDPPLDAELVLLDRTGELGRWTLDGPYQAFAPDEGGRYVLVSAPNRRLSFENRVEVIDLNAPGVTIPLSLRSLGGEVPEAAAFSPPLPVASGDPLRVAALFAAGQLSLFDLDAPDNPPVTIPTTVSGTGRGPTPRAAQFVGREIVVTTASTTQLLVITLNDVAGEGGLRFDPSIRTLATNGPVRRVTVDERSDPPRLLVLSGSTLQLFELSTGAEAEVPVSPQHTDVALFDGPAPGDPTVRPRLLTYGASSALTFVDLGEGPTEVLDVFQLALTTVPADVDVDAEGGRLVLFTSAGSQDGPFETFRSPFALLDLFDRSATPLGVTAIDRAFLSPAGRSLWLAGTSDGYVGRLDLETAVLEERFLPADDGITALVPLSGETERALVFVRDGFRRLDAFHVLTPGTLEAGGRLPFERL